MTEVIAFGILSFTSFFTLINPFGTMPIFMTMTADLDNSHRTKTAQKAAVVSFITIIVFAFSGQVLFNFFGISVHSFRVVGGVIFFLMGMDMLQARLGKVKMKESEIKTYVDDISVTPLAIPMICGPGAMTNAIVMMEDADSVEKKIALILGAFAVILCTYLILYSASKIIKILGQTGINVMMRLMGLIVMVIAVEFFFTGLKPILIDIFK
jgi:multiple antibiotic resistance protein